MREEARCLEKRVSKESKRKRNIRNRNTFYTGHRNENNKSRNCGAGGKIVAQGQNKLDAREEYPLASFFRQCVYANTMCLSRNRGEEFFLYNP